MKTTKILPGTILASLALAAIPAQAQLIKCVTAQGKTVYQDHACEESAKQSTLRGATPPAPPPPAEAAKDDKAPKDDKAAKGAPAKPAIPEATTMAIENFVGYAICSEKVPGFAQKYMAPYERWKDKNQAQLERLNNPAEARTLDERLAAERARSEGVEERCHSFGQQLAASAPVVEAK